VRTTLVLLFSLCCLTPFNAHAAKKGLGYVDTTIGYGVFLPDNWDVITLGDSQSVFLDTSDSMGGIIVLEKELFDQTKFTADDQWTRVNTIEYSLYTTQTYDPAGTILFMDSTQSAKIDSLWAPELYASFAALNDTILPNWHEYIRYVSVAGRGFTIYCISTPEDMTTHLGDYAFIISTISFAYSPTSETTLIRRGLPITAGAVPIVAPSAGAYTLDGRKVAQELYRKHLQGKLIQRIISRSPGQ